jgi:hypothetical protein
MTVQSADARRRAREIDDVGANTQLKFERKSYYM